MCVCVCVCVCVCAYMYVCLSLCMYLMDFADLNHFTANYLDIIERLKRILKQAGKKVIHAELIKVVFDPRALHPSF